MVTTTFAEGAERNRALGIWGAVAGAGGAAGVLLGGVLTEWAGWEWVLFVNTPIGLAAAALAPRVLVESRETEESGAFDLPGAVTITAGLVCSSTRSSTPPTPAGARPTPSSAWCSQCSSSPRSS
ncbi:MAG: MFS transporter [Patulibacter minatonensis]